MIAASDYSAHMRSPPGLCYSLFWSPTDNLNPNVSDTLFPFFSWMLSPNLSVPHRSLQFLVHCASLGPPHDVTGRLHPLIRCDFLGSSFPEKKIFLFMHLKNKIYFFRIFFLSLHPAFKERLAPKIRNFLFASNDTMKTRKNFFKTMKISVTVKIHPLCTS